MKGYTLTINGIDHRVTFVDGKKVYDPPLSKKEERGRIKEIIETRSFPGVSTDTTFLAGRGTLEDQFDGDTESLNEVIAAARKKGFNPTPNMVYMPPLADSPGDPEAFLSAGEGKGAIRRLCEKRGWSCDGLVKVKGREPEKDPYTNPKHKLHPSIVRAEVDKLRKQGVKGDTRELQERVIDKHSIHK